jgi:hypothetical protein
VRTFLAGRLEETPSLRFRHDWAQTESEHWRRHVTCPYIYLLAIVIDVAANPFRPPPANVTLVVRGSFDRLTMSRLFLDLTSWNR